MTNRTMIRLTALAGSAVMMLSLGACSSVGSALGITKDPPDEFAIVTKAPLVLPPDYTLKPPQPGAPRPQEETPANRARSLVFDSAGRTASGVSSAEATLIARTGADAANPDIRRVITEETTALLEKEQTVANKILFWNKPELPEEVVNAAAEAERIRETRARGETVTGQETPTITRRAGGLF
ncbi:MAG: DUF3035 domain-containing protein [Alphaproteobacteria bacterium]|nr:DUF3035 domain-containing protein [Alphaproteobacteria bacterium]